MSRGNARQDIVEDDHWKEQANGPSVPACGTGNETAIRFPRSTETLAAAGGSMNRDGGAGSGNPFRG